MPHATLTPPSVWMMCFICIGLSGCTSSNADQPSTPPPSSKTLSSATTAAPSTSLTLPSRVRRGVCFAHNWQAGGSRGYGTVASAEALGHLKGLNVNWISVTPFGWMRSVHANEVKGEHSSKIPNGGERRERVIKVIQQARARNMRVMLKPHIWISKGAWRGKIAPRDAKNNADWNSWWSSYEAFMMYYAKIAQAQKVESLVLGVELVSALKQHPDRFLALIAKVRAVYKGELTYSANWDEMLDMRIWRALDAVSTQLYPPLSQSTTPKRAALERALRPHLAQWSTIAKKANKPLLITEVGYKSAPNAVIEPFGWPERLPKSMKKPDPALQKLAYEALFAELKRVPNLGGVFIWKYFTDKTTTEEGPMGFSPRGKPAEQAIKRAYDRINPAP